MILNILLVLLMSGFFQRNNGFKLNFPVHIPAESRFSTGDKLQEKTSASLQSQLSSALERLDKTEKEVHNKLDAVKSDFRTLQTDLRAVKSEVQTVNSSLQEVSIMKSDEQQTGNKVANLASTVAGLESKSEKVEEHIGELTERLSTAEAKASMGSPCYGNSDCLVERSLCINNVCVCDPGLAYHPEKNMCVHNCTTYGQHYTALRGYYIGDHNVQNFYGLSEVQCKDACTAVTSYVCRSADLRTRDGYCSLTHESLKTVPQSSYRVESKISVITHYSRNCLT